MPGGGHVAFTVGIGKQSVKVLPRTPDYVKANTCQPQHTEIEPRLRTGERQRSSSQNPSPAVGKTTSHNSQTTFRLRQILTL